MNHYQRLGVSPKASANELRDAYRRAARGAHPDRHGEGSASRMAAVNEAWRVLGDRDLRRRYDDELSAGAVPTPGSTTGSTPGSTTGSTAGPGGAPRPSAEPTVWSTPGPARVPWRFMLGMLVAGVLVVVVGHLLTEPSPGSVPDGILQTGDCVSVSAALEAAEVSCSIDHDAVVSVLIPFDQTCPSGTEGYRDRQGMGTACVVRPAP